MSSPVEEIKARLDVVELIQGYIKLEKSGVNFRAVCPFHSEKTPSFFVSPTRQIWHCFGGCNKGGDIFRFVMEIEGCDFAEALKLLATRAGVTLTREDPALRSERNRLYDINEAATALFEKTLLLTSAPKEYLKKRGVTEETVRAFRLGFAPESWNFLLRSLTAKKFKPEEIEKSGLVIHSSSDSSYHDRFRSRIIFPIADSNGRIVGFGGRIFEHETLPHVDDAKTDAEKSQREPAVNLRNSATAPAAKYINTPQTLLYDKSRTLYGFDKAKNEIRVKNQTVVVEGYMDCIMAHQAGVKNTIAVSGTALTSVQLGQLKRLSNTVLSSFDADSAGESATKRTLQLAEEFGFERKIVVIPSGKDPADTVQEDPALWVQAVESAKPVVEFYFDRAFQKFDPETREGKKEIGNILLPLVRRLSSEIEKAHWIKKIAEGLGIGEDSIQKELLRHDFAETNEYHDQRSSTQVITVPVLRRDLLEEEFLAFLTRIDDETKMKLRGTHSIRFRSPSYERIFSFLIGANADSEEIAGYADLISALRFKSEILEERGSDITKEFEVARRELEKESIRDHLMELGTQIAKKEKEHDEGPLADLLSEFQILSTKLKFLST